MRRRLPAILSGLSLLLCVAVLALWVRSYWAVDTVLHVGPAETVWWSETGQLGLNRSYPGEVGLIAAEAGWAFHTFPAVEREDFDFTNGQQFRYRALGFEVSSHRPAPPTANVPGAGMRYWVVAVPHWFVAAVLALPPALWLRRGWRRNRAARLGLCPSCGYDLRATPGRCPECGTAAAAGGPA